MLSIYPTADQSPCPTLSLVCFTRCATLPTNTPIPLMDGILENPGIIIIIRLGVDRNPGAQPATQAWGRSMETMVICASMTEMCSPTLTVASVSVGRGRIWLYSIVLQSIDRQIPTNSFYALGHHYPDCAHPIHADPRWCMCACSIVHLYLSYV
jgi:hypothetical protein